MNKPLNDKTALVTGASGGIGAAIARRLASDGALVAVAYGGNAEGARATLAAIEAEGGRGFLVRGDVATKSGRAALFEALDEGVRERTGATGLDILVNNAGVAPTGALEELDEETFDRTFDVNVKGLVFTTQAASGRLNDGGRIVNISTGITRFSFPMYAAYAPSKGAVDVFTRTMAAHFAGRSITVNAVAPGAIETDMFRQGPGASQEGRDMILSIQALKRIGQPDDIASVVAFLARPDAGWVTGQWIEASGGSFL